jgi:hypothetical protein
MKKSLGVILSLTQNSAERRAHLKTSLYFLFKNFNSPKKRTYDVVILHEGDYDDEASQMEITMGIRSSCRSCLFFRKLDQGDFDLPPHIDVDRLRRSIDARPTNYWRSERYRMMCRWWLVHMPKYVSGYEYVMRLDDDSIIEEPIDDLFEISKTGGYTYLSNIVHLECPMCCYGMQEFFEKMFSSAPVNLKAVLTNLFVPSTIIPTGTFLDLLRINHEDTMKPLSSPLIYYNNWFVAKTSFFTREDVRHAVEKIDLDGSIFYYRWGDAPLQTILLHMFAEPGSLMKANFKYSKRYQREAYRGDDGCYQCCAPASYESSSSI